MRATIQMLTASDLLAEADAAEAKSQALRAEADEAEAKSQAIRAKLAQLQKEVATARDRLALAESQYAALKAKLELFLLELAATWGLRDGYGDAKHSGDYTAVAASREKLAHWPAVKAFLTSELARVEQALQEFQRGNA